MEDPLGEQLRPPPCSAAPARAYTAVDLALIRLLRSAMELDWAPGTAVPAVLDAVGGSTRLLRQTRIRLLSRVPTQRTEIGSRALATLAVALMESGAIDTPD